MLDNIFVQCVVAVIVVKAAAAAATVAAPVMVIGAIGLGVVTAASQR